MLMNSGSPLLGSHVAYMKQQIGRGPEALAYVYHVLWDEVFLRVGDSYVFFLHSFDLIDEFFCMDC